MHIYIYIYAVKLKTGPRFALFKVKNWSIFLVFFFLVFFFFIFENLILPAERRGFLKKNKQKQQQKKTQFLKLKTGPIMLRNILGPVLLGPVFNFRFLFFFVFFVFVFGWNPYFYSVFSKKCKIERNTKKQKKTLFVNTPVLTVLVKMSFFSAFLIFAAFGISMFFQRCFW